MSFSSITDGLVTRFRNHFSDELNETRCQFDNIDGVFEAVLSEGANYACTIHFNGGGPQHRQSMEARGSGPVDWSWSYVGVFLIRYRGDVDMREEQKRVVEKLSQVLREDFRLGGVTPLARFTEIGAPEPSQIGDVYFDWIPFIVEVLEK